MFTWWSGSQLETLVNEGLVEDMTDFWDEYVIPNGVSADVAGSLTFDGKIYGVPYSCLLYTSFLGWNCYFDISGQQEPAAECLETVSYTHLPHLNISMSGPMSGSMWAGTASFT